MDKVKMIGGIVVLIVVAIAVISIIGSMSASPAMETVTVENVFVDINQDGLQDLLVNGTVVLNRGNNVNFQTP